MAKRFTDTGKWDDPWFCGLGKDDKLFWDYVCGKCDHAGIWKVNIPLAQFHLGADYLPEIKRFGGRIKPLSSEKWIICSFVDFQYGELNPANRAHLSVINILKKEGAYKALKRPFQADKDMDKVKDKDTDNFEEFWKAYPRKVGKGCALKAWVKISPSKDLQEKIISAVGAQKSSKQWLKDGGQFIPHPATWLNAGRWDDEPDNAGGSDGKGSAGYIPGKYASG